MNELRWIDGRHNDGTHNIIHECSQFEELNPDRLAQDGPYLWGIALLNRAYRGTDGRIFMDNDEYGVVVQFCPYCGIDLRPLPNLPWPR